MEEPEIPQANTEAQQPDGPAGTPLPEDPFPCPDCGQMLAPTCRVCVACGVAIDPSQIHPRPLDVPPVEFTPAAHSTLPPVRFSWRIFAAVLTAWLAAAVVAQRFLNPVQEQFFLAGIVCVSTIWVFYDARARKVPRAFRWSLACILFWIIFFPWYLARRRTPEAPCPIMDESTSRLLPWIIPIFVLLLVASLVAALLHGRHH